MYLVVVPGKAFLEENKDLENIASIEDAAGDVLSFFWEDSNGSTPLMRYLISNEREVTQWCAKIHEANVRLTLQIPQTSLESSTSESFLNAAIEKMIGLRKSLEDQLESKKKKRGGQIIGANY